MNREILFRGKRVDNGEWFYGTGIVPVKHNTHDTDKWELVEKVNYDELDCFIPSYYSEEIDINTLGQYTGLTDKNDNKIFEGDRVKAKFFGKDVEGEIGFCDGCFLLWNSCVSDNQLFIFTDIEVIGNIHDGGNE